MQHAVDGRESVGRNALSSSRHQAHREELRFQGGGRPWYSCCRGLVLGGLIFSVLSTTGCRSSAFNFATTQPPRLSVIHRPLNPRPDQEIVIEARAEAAPGRRVAEIRIDVSRPVAPPAEGEPRIPGHQDLVCRDAQTCTLRLPPGGAVGRGLYSATMEDDLGARASSRSGFGFLVGRTGGEIVPLREPVNLLVDDSVFKILLARDQTSYPIDDRQALMDAEALLYEGLLADPALRWRDHQLAFYWSTYGGRTSGYHSGLRSRCGQAPWLGTRTEGNAGAAAAFADVVAILHLRSEDRDCAGLQEGGTPRGLSAFALNPSSFSHELGHALFGLADEYWESTDSRTARMDVRGDPDPLLCTCCSPPVDGFCPPEQQECTGFNEFPAECYEADPVCPPIESSCAQANIFNSRLSCQRAVAEILAFSGLGGSVTEADCRQLCGPGSRPCPCLPPASTEGIWILDRRRPGASGAGLDDDLMGTLDTAIPTELFGPACHRCIETSFCIAWEEGRGRSGAQIAAHCGTAP